MIDRARRHKYHDDSRPKDNGLSIRRAWLILTVSGDESLSRRGKKQ